MSVLERFVSPIRSRDAAVRLKAVQKHTPEDTGTLADLARSDPDPRVRKEAVRRLEAPRVLLELTDTAGDEAVRRLARSRGEALLIKIAADDRDEAESRRALGLLTPLRAVAEVACRAHFGPIRAEALARLTGAPAGRADRDPALATVAGKAAEPALRSHALEAIGSPDGLLQVAVSAEDRETSQAAVRRLEDPGLLLAAATGATSKSVRRLARRRAEERLPADHPERVQLREKALGGLLERLADADPASPDRAASLLEEADALIASGPVGAELTARLEELRGRLEAGGPRSGRVARLLVPEEQTPSEGVDRPPSEEPEQAPELPPAVEEILARLQDPEGVLGLPELDLAERECLALLEGLASTEDVRARLRTAVGTARNRALERKKARVRVFQLGELADHAVSLAKSLGERPAGPEIAPARRELARLTRRFDRLEPPASPDAERFRKAVEDISATLDAAESAHKGRVRRAEERIATLGERLAALESSESFPLDEAETALRELGKLRSDATVWRLVGPERQTRFQRLQATLMPRLREAREVREWRHWSNLEEQTELIRRARALAEVEDLQRVDRELTALERAWHGARHTGRDRGQELWEEWAEVRRTLLERIGPLREAAERELGEKLDALRALVEKAEEITESGDPRRAAEIRSLMPEWRERAKGIGKRSERLWKRFRAANDRYFSELKALRKQRNEEFAANIPIREELIARAKALFDQTDRETVRNAVRDLMREWKESPPVPRKEGDRLWEEFRSACDGARDRLREGRGDAETETTTAPESAPPSQADADLRGRIASLTALPVEERRDAAVALWDDYRRISRSGDRLTRDTTSALFSGLREILEGDPDSFSGTRLDQEQLVSRLATLLEEMEALSRPSASVASEGGVIDFAEHLRRTLQAGRAADRGAVLREAAQDAARILERAHAAGPALSRPATETLGRLEGLARKVIARAPSVEEKPERRNRGRFRARGSRPPRG